MRLHLAVHGYPPLSHGGTQQYTAAVARHLCAAGHSVTVLAYSPGDSAEVLASEELMAGQRVIWLSFDPRRSANPMLEEYANPRVAERLERLWRTERPDLLHVTYPGLLSTATVAVARSLAIPTVVTLTDMWAICPVGTMLRHDGVLCPGPDDVGHCIRCVTGMGPRGRPYAALARSIPRSAWRTLARASETSALRSVRYASWLAALAARPTRVRETLLSADALLSPGRFAVHMFERNGFPADSVRVMPHGIEAPETFRRTSQLAGTAAGTLRLGYIGPLARFKGAHVPLEAFQALPAGKDLTLAYFGAIPERSSADRYARGLLRAIEATPGVTHRGPYAHALVADVLAQIDVLIVPSLCYENTPMVMYEALASGTPVIATAEGGMRELVEELGGGWLFPRGDAQALAALLARLRSHPDEVRAMAGTIRPVPRLADHVAALEGVYACVASAGGLHG